MLEESVEQILLSRIQELETRLEESQQLIDAIRAGEVDAFAIKRGERSEVFTLETGDYAYRLLIEECGEGAINTTEEGLIVYTNNYFFELLKFPPEKLLGSSIFDFIHPRSREKFTQLFRKALSGKSKGEINLLVNNIVIPIYVSLTSLQPKLATVGIIITDLTEKKKNEEIILEYQKDLEDKNHTLIQVNKELDSFAYIASHDLQEPLRKIQTFATLIVEKEAGNLSQTGKDQFMRMQKSAKRMQTLIENLLTYSRTNTAERKYENTDLNKIVAEVKEELKEELLQKNATIETSAMCHGNIIPFQFKQLLVNLIGNSLKFSNPEQSIVIKIKSRIGKGNEFGEAKLEQEKEYCHISISDNGIGFDQQYSEKIFELFKRLHGNTQFAGTGIGLSIVKKIVENHNGIITANSEIGKGATFNIYIPA